jgi:2-dehydro-3-deoxygalactonokinase
MLIGLDWNATGITGFVMGGGRIVDRRQTGDGVLEVAPDGFQAAFDRIVLPWLEHYGSMPILACGTVGSRQGWIETPYLDCPADATEIANNLTEVHNDFWIVPGLCNRGEGAPDVMRGQETRLVGHNADGLYVIPGYHSRWALVDGGSIVRFASYMTGELRAMLKAQGIDGRRMTDDDDPVAFDRGLLYAMEKGGGLLHRLFSVRALGRLGELAETSLCDYVAGLLIGAEVLEGLATFGEDLSVTVECEGELGRRYRRALAMAGIAERERVPEAVAHGLYEIGSRAAMF